MSDNSSSSSRRRPSPSSSTPESGIPAHGPTSSTSAHHLSGGPPTPNNLGYIYQPRPSPEELAGRKKHNYSVRFSPSTPDDAWSPAPSKGPPNAKHTEGGWVPQSHPHAVDPGHYNPPASPTPAPSRTYDHLTLPQSAHLPSFSSNPNNVSTSQLPHTPRPDNNAQLPDVPMPIHSAHSFPTSPASTGYASQSFSTQSPISQAPRQSTSPHMDVELDYLLRFHSPYSDIAFDVRDYCEDIRIRLKKEWTSLEEVAARPAFSPPRRSIIIRLTTPSVGHALVAIKAPKNTTLTVGFLLFSLCEFMQKPGTPPSSNALSGAEVAFGKRISRIVQFHPSRYEDERGQGLKNVDLLEGSFTWLGLEQAKDLVEGKVVWDLRLA